MKIGKYILACALALMLLAPLAAGATSTDTDTSTPVPTSDPFATQEPDGYAAAGDVTLGSSLIATDDQEGNVSVKLFLMYKESDVIDGRNLELFEVWPVVDEYDDYPFVITWTSYIQNMYDQKTDGDRNPFRELREAAGRNTRNYFQFDFTRKPDLLNGYYPVTFKVRFLHKGQDIRKTPTIEQTITVYVHIRYGKEPETPTPTPTEKPVVAETPKPVARVILKRYTMNPSEVTGGDSFDLTLVLENTNANMAVRNMKCSITEAKGTVLPESGSSSFFIESIAAQETAEVTLRMMALPDAGVEPVQMTLAMEYDDKNASNKESEDFTLPIHQVIKLDIDEPTYASDAYVDEPFNLMLRFYNTGKSTMYNTRAFLESDTLTADDTLFAGTLAPGGQQLFDVMVTAPSDKLMYGEMGDMGDMGGDMGTMEGIEPRGEGMMEEAPAEDVILDDAVGSVFVGYSASAGLARVPAASVAVSSMGGYYGGGGGGGGMRSVVCTGNVIITYEDNYGTQYRKETPITVNVMSFDQAYQGNGMDFYYGKDYDPSTGLYIDRETGLYYDPMTQEVVDRGVNPFVYIGIAAAAVAVIVVVLIIVLRIRKKNRVKREQQMEEMEEEAEDAREEGSGNDEVD